MVSVLYVLIGFVLLVWGADHFVAGASSLAKKLGVPPLIIGLTVVAFGTSAPELTVSVTAGMAGSNEIAISNVLGSNLFNLLMVAGGCAVISPLVTEEDLFKRDWPICIFAMGLLFALIAFDGVLSRFDGVLLFVCFVSVILFQVTSAIKAKQAGENVPEEEIADATPFSIAINIIAGIACIVIGGDLTVDGAIEIARMLNVSDTVIGLTVIAIGTSLPELVTSLTATKKGENGMAMGNVIGSNLFNIFLILGISASLTPIPVEFTAIMDSGLVFAICIIMFFIAKQDKFGRSVGIASVATYFAYTAWVVLRTATESTDVVAFLPL